MARSGISVELGEPIQPVPEPAVHVILAVGLLKGDQMDAVVRDSTMLGVARIVPMRTDHVAVPGRAGAGERAASRWRRIAVSSAKQCRRSVVPHVASVSTFAAVLRETERNRTFIATEPALAPNVPESTGPPVKPVGSAQQPPKTALVLVGPEGGWSRGELELAFQAGAEPRQLGPRTLRAESAPTVLLSALWTEWGWV
jgi:16S rRNA (uracil1498-N3)-methyltransferase